MTFKKVLGYAVTFLICGGVIATVLVILMVPSISQSSSSEEVLPPDPTEAPPPTEATPIVTTKPPLGNGFAYAEVPGLGSLKGYIPPEGSAIFAGIPFSEPPTGKNRWKNPVPLTNLNYEGSYYDATFARDACPQICELPSPQYVCPGIDQMSEDCLHINVYVPKKLLKTSAVNAEGGFGLIDNIENAKIPVMVFIYGGAFIAGGNGVSLYDARFLAEKGEVVIAVPNYRIGPFGFFYQNNGTTDPALGNFGIWDQIEALRWVQAKISGFGGDPSQVTVFGQSAGGQSVAVHLVNKHSDPLFQAAIMESNPFGINYKTTEEAQETCNNFVDSFKTNKCTPNDMDCLRQLSVGEILAALAEFPFAGQINVDSLSQLFEPWAPIYDGDLLTQHPYYTFLEGKNQDKPILHGTTKDEGMFFIVQAATEPLQSNRAYDLLLKIMFGNESLNAIKALYPADCPDRGLPHDCDNRYVIDDVVTDYMFTCPSRRVFNTGSRLQDPNLKVWWYTFNQVWSFPEFWENYTECADLVCHAAELPYVFDLDNLIPEYAFTDEESLLADKLVYYWSNFAKFGNPNPPAMRNRKIRSAITVNKLNSKAEGFPPQVEYWPMMYEATEGSGGGSSYDTMNLIGSGEAVVSDFMKEKCDFWDSLDLYLKDEIKLGNRFVYKLQKMLEIFNS